jgi:hypothetical protein
MSLFGAAAIPCSGRRQVAHFRSRASVALLVIDASARLPRLIVIAIIVTAASGQVCARPRGQRTSTSPIAKSRVVREAHRGPDATKQLSADPGRHGADDGDNRRHDPGQDGGDDRPGLIGRRPQRESFSIA